MKIKRLVIENFKSIERIELIEPNPFTVFVGPNGSGKSNIFEALEFHIPQTDVGEKLRLFGGADYLQNRLIDNSSNYRFQIETDTFVWARNSSYQTISELDANKLLVEVGLVAFDEQSLIKNEERYLDFARRFSRIFVGNEKLLRKRFIDDSSLNGAATNLEKVLKRVLTDIILKNEFFEWLALFVPEFKSVEVIKNQYSTDETLLWYEQFSDKPFTKNLISDGTYNILALLTAVYQSDDRPQFLCIEEPENGLHPQVAGELVDFFRTMCEERGHYIWLNTHSQTMASRVRPEELVVVDKKQGSTRIRQFNGDDLKGWRMDEAWLTNALGGGLPW
ncbi:AAA family ATPase [Arsenicibacter rosenii]|uniref:Chromosome segregation protein SMC n=1 Tax=Arsenicibacter rosenii TaxID=1750698 RepID=A0A1S2VS56_9BACT|nr:ATP-binding protein [Arsenicibacter rosenii]OIN61116.1 chromosome segregation protein SMC [Arsenicibacter rosenii]